MYTFIDFYHNYFKIYLSYTLICLKMSK